MAQAMERLLATPKTIPVFPSSSGMFVPFGSIIATSSRHRQMREERLGRAALGAEEVECVAPPPRIGGVTNGTEGGLLRERPFAVIAGHRVAGRVHIVFATDFTA